MHYPLCYGERPTPGDVNGRPSEPRFYAICRAKTSEARGWKALLGQQLQASHETVMTAPVLWGAAYSSDAVVTKQTLKRTNDRSKNQI